MALGRRAVDLVGQDHVGEDRSLHEPEDAATRGPILLDHLRARDVRGHEVGGELDAAELEVQRFGQGLDEERLRQAGNAHEQHVPVGQEGRQELVDDVSLAHDPLLDLRPHGFRNLGGALEELDVAVGERRCWRGHLAPGGVAANNRAPFSRPSTGAKRGASGPGSALALFFTRASFPMPTADNVSLTGSEE
jgi:hypothetical protein